MYSKGLSRAWCLAALCTVVLGVSPAGAEPRMDFDGCVRKCDAGLVKVADTEKSCIETLRFVVGDLEKVTEAFRGSDLCNWRRKSVCEDFRKVVVPALDQLTTLLRDIDDCRKVDSKQVAGLLWTLELKTACKGDGVFTDLHDYLTARPPSIARINGLQTHYVFSREPIPTDGDLFGHMPSCDEGIRPSSHYIWPLLSFHRALASIGDWQTCMSGCRKPTDLEKRLWKLEELVNQVRLELDATAEAARAGVEARRTALLHGHTTFFPCTPFSRLEADLKEHAQALDRFTETISNMLLTPDATDTRIAELEAEAEQLAVSIRANNFDIVKEACAKEDARAEKLRQRKRAAVDTVLRSQAFSIEAADTFVGLSGALTPCDWTGQCNIPLTCRDGACKAGVTLDRVRPILASARRTADKGLKLALHDDKGLNPEAATQLDRIEREIETGRQDLAALGWPDAVEAWRHDYASSLTGRIQALLTESDATLASFSGEAGEALPPACRKKVSTLRRDAADLRALQGALGNPDPVAGPSWVSLKAADLARISDAIAASSNDLTQTCRIEAGEGFPTWGLAAAGGGVLLLVVGLAAWFLWQRSRRERGAGGF